MAIGRIFCVSLPTVLTVGAILSLLFAGLTSGVINYNNTMMHIDASKLSLSAILKNALDANGIHFGQPNLPAITASMLGLNDTYDVGLWGYCYTKAGKTACTKPQFNWAAYSLDDSYLKDLAKKGGTTVPQEYLTVLDSFRQLSKYTQIGFIVSLVALGLQLILGVFSIFSRAMSCLTYVISSIAAVLVFATACLATSLTIAPVAVIEATSKGYGGRANIYTRFLVVIWICFAFALATPTFWLATICCCKPEHRSRSKKNNHGDGEKLLPTRGYAPLGNDHDNTGYHSQTAPVFNINNGGAAPPRYPSGTGRSDLAYEPYSHRA